VQIENNIMTDLHFLDNTQWLWL